MNGRQRRWGLVFGLLTVLVLGSWGAAGAQTTQPQRATTLDQDAFEQTPCFLPMPEGVIDGEDVLCGYVTVPVRHAQPDGDTLQLAVGVIKATGDDPAPDPLVLENGGPGVPSLISMPGLIGLDMFHRTRDLVFIDQRGTGFSQPQLLCESGAHLLRETYGQNLDDASALDLELAIQRECYTDLRTQGIDVDAFNSLENAADIAAVMEVLGYEEYNFYGISYSSALAQHLLRDHPDGLRSVVLDGVVPLHINFTQDVPQTTQRAFDLLFDSCAADAVCNTHFPDLRQTFYDLVAQYDAEPVTHSFANPWTGDMVEGVVTGESLIMALYQHLYDAGADPDLPASIAALAEGDPHFIEHYVAPTRFGTLRLMSGMSNAVICSEFLTQLPKIENVNPAVAKATLWFMDYTPVCAIWEIEPLPDYAFEPVESDIPTLVLSGEYDPITPPENGDTVAETLSNAYVYTFPGAGHGAMGSSTCGFAIVLDFINDPTRAPDAACLDQIDVEFAGSLDAAEQFDVEFAGSLDAAEQFALAPVELPDMGLRAVVPERWVMQQPGVFIAPGQEYFAVIMRDASFDAVLAGLDNPAISGSIDVGGHVWTIYGAGFQGYLGTVAITIAAPPDDSNGVVFVGLFSATADQLNTLTDTILLDMLAGVTFE